MQTVAAQSLKFKYANDLLSPMLQSHYTLIHIILRTRGVFVYHADKRREPGVVCFRRIGRITQVARLLFITSAEAYAHTRCNTVSRAAASFYIRLFTSEREISLRRTVRYILTQTQCPDTLRDVYKLF